MPIDFETIRKDIAVKHNVLLGKDDPILVAVSLNEMVLSHYLDLISENYAEQSRQLVHSFQAHTEQSLTQATATAEKIITQSTDYVSAEIKKVVHEASAEAYALAIKQSASLNDDLKRQLVDQSATILEARSSRNIAIIAAVIAIACALVALFVAIK